MRISKQEDLLLTNHGHHEVEVEVALTTPVDATTETIEAEAIARGVIVIQMIGRRDARMTVQLDLRIVVVTTKATPEAAVDVEGATIEEVETMTVLAVPTTETVSARGRMGISGHFPSLPIQLLISSFKRSKTDEPKTEAASSTEKSVDVVEKVKGATETAAVNEKKRAREEDGADEKPAKKVDTKSEVPATAS